jgi:hypothetical protein
MGTGAGADVGLSLKLFPVTEARDELLALRYQAYLEAGLIEPSDAQVYSDRFDELPSTLLIGAFDESGCIGTLRLSFSENGTPDVSLPCESTYPEVAPLKQADVTIMELGRLALHPSIKNCSYRSTVYGALVRSGVLTCMATDVALTLVTSQLKWRAFYEYICGFKAISEPRLYPPGGVPVVLFSRDFRTADTRRIAQNRFFRISEEEVAELREAVAPILTWRHAPAVEDVVVAA